ncbi:hypothetical protein SDC9_91312 [bioreactor metagenome]|jgi:hypothetical protein|uniref:Uncharacterized protein n=1 Tax=bioreactor metagenome TaxID=1076179 RepID=A0A645A1B2_9ZZZZ
MRYPLTIQEIMSTDKGIPDATFKGGMNWGVPGTFRGHKEYGNYELILKRMLFITLILHTNEV